MISRPSTTPTERASCAATARDAAALLEELLELGRAGGLDAMGVAPADPLVRARAALHERRAAGLAAGMQFTYKNPDRSTDPARAVKGARSIVVGARPYLLAEPPPPADASARRRPLRLGRPLRPAARRPVGASPVGCAPTATRRSPSPTTTPSSTARSPIAAGIGWFGKNANLLARRRRAAGSCSAASSPPPRCRWPPQPVRRRLRHVPAVPRRLPDRGDRRARRGRRRPLPGVAAAEARARSPRSCGPPSATASTAATTARRSARRPCASGRAARRRRASADAVAWVDVLDLLDADDDELLARRGRWYLAERDPRWLRRNALVVLGNVGDGRPTPTVVATARRATDRADDDAAAAEHAESAPTATPRPGRAPSWPSARMKHLLVTNDFPPKIGGIQSLLWEWWRRLPPESFAVLTSPYDGAAAFDAEQPFRIERVPRAGAAAAPVDGAARSTSWPREVGADLVVLDPALPLGLVGPSLRPARTTWCCTAPRSPCPAGCRAVEQALGHVLRRRPPRHRRRWLPGGRGRARRRPARCRSPSCRPGVDTERFRPLDDDERGAARAALRPAASTAS